MVTQSTLPWFADWNRENGTHATKEKYDRPVSFVG